MKRRILCVLLSAVLLCGIVLIAPSAAASEMSTSDKCIQMLKEMEGFAKYPYWDYMHWTVGYGTRCPDEDLERYKQNGITEAEADALLRAAVSSFDKSINSFADKYSLNLSQNQFDALLLFCYNLGNGWMFSESNFRSAVINGATGNDFIIAIARWCNAGGQVMPTLVKRRLMEANMYLNGVYDKDPPPNYCYVLYDAQGGKSDESIQAYDSDLTAEPVATATYEGYFFDGWYTEPQGGTKVTLLDAGVGTRTLYAHWKTENETPEPTEPEPTEPEPTEPAPTEPEPTEPAPTEPAPTEPTPTEPTPTEPPVETPSETWMGTVTGQDLRIRTGAGTGYSVVGYLNRGDRVEILEQKTVGSMVWGKISRGWISMSYVKLDASADNGGNEGGDEGGTGGEAPGTWTGTVTTTDLRIRSGPGTSYAILGYLNTGDRVTITEQTTSGSMTWGRTEKGWICMSYVKLDEDPGAPSGSVMGTVKVSDFLRIRKGPGTSYAIAGYLNPGDRIEILEQKTVNGSLWGRIEKGWVSMDYVVLDPVSGEEEKPAPETKTVIGDLLYIRSGPGTSNSIVGYLYYGSKVEILEQTTADGRPWGRISKGWICLDYVK